MSERKYSPKRHIPKAIKELNSFSPIEISKHLSNKYNLPVSSDSISKWKTRNPVKIKKLERELSKKSDEIEKRKEIWECIERGISKEEIMQKTQCSKAYYYQLFEEYENYTKILKEDESKDSPIIEPTEEPKIKNHIKKVLPVLVEKPRVQARSRPKKEGLKPRKIKLMLNDYKDYRIAIQHALDNAYRFTKYNIKETSEYLKELKEKLYSPPEYLRKIEGIESFRTIPKYETSSYLDMLNRIHNAIKKGDVKTAKDIGYRLSVMLVMITKKQIVEVRGQFSIIKDELFYVPIWIKHLEDILELKQMSRKEIREVNLTTKEWYEKMKIEFPQSLEPEANEVIENEADLIRTGIFGDLEYRIKKGLRIDNERERYYYTTENLTSLDIFRIKDLIREDPYDPYSIMLKEKLQDSENIK